MAEILKELKTKIALKSNTYEYWTGEGATYVPLKGEVCICELSSDNTVVQTNPPTILFKVGTYDGTNEATKRTFAQLNWASALAADVYSWAKAETVILEGETLTFKNADGTSAYTVDLSAFATDAVVGDLASLTTKEKGSLVAAINEVLAAVGTGGTAAQVTIIERDPTEDEVGIDTVYEIKQGDTLVGSIKIPESTKVEASEENGNIKVDGEEIKVYDDVFKTDITTVDKFGGIAAGSNLNGMTTHEILNTLLFPYVVFTINSVSRSAAAAILENGATQTLNSASISITKKSKPITSVKLLNGSTVLGEKTGDAVAAGGTITFSDLGITVTKNNNPNLKFTVTDGQTSSDKNVGASTFVYPYYMGECAADAVIDEALVEGLTKKVESKGNKTVTHTCENGRMIIAYPKVHGVLKSILDPNNFETIGDYTRSEVSITGLDNTAQTYYVYASGAATVTNFKVQYKY